LQCEFRLLRQRFQLRSRSDVTGKVIERREQSGRVQSEP
jgi:hypothetical protein